MLFQPRGAGFDFGGRGRAVAGAAVLGDARAALQYIADEDVLPADPAGGQGLVEQRSRSAHKWPSRGVLVLTGAFADYHKRRVGVSLAENDVAPGARKIALRALDALLAQGIKLLGYVAFHWSHSLEIWFQLLVRAVQSLGNDLYVRKDRHEVGVAVPSGDHVQVDVVGDPRPGSRADVDADIETVGPGDLRRAAQHFWVSCIISRFSSSVSSLMSAI